jgi:hypothetical protein
MSDLKAFYEKKLKPSLLEMDSTRKKIRTRILFSILGFFTVFPAMLIFIKMKGMPSMGFMVVLISIIYFLFCIKKVKKLYAPYQKEFKKTVIQKIVQMMNPSFIYSPNNHIPLSLFESSGIFTAKQNSYYGDDYVKGRVGDADIEFSELDVSRVTCSGKNQSRKTIFKGLFFSADFNKHFNTKTFVLTDVAETLFGSLGAKFQMENKSRGDLVKLENTAFEKAFSVYSGDQIEARHLLTPVMMERIMHFRVSTKRKVQLSFVDNRLYVAIPFNKNLFEPRIWSTIERFSDIETFHGQLSLATSVVEMLNQNTRVWSKQKPEKVVLPSEGVSSRFIIR